MAIILFLMEFSQNDAQIVSLALVEALGLLSPLDHYTYHNSAHTRDVFGRSQRLCRREELEPEEAAEVAVAAAFHDTGFLDTPVNNEPAGAQRARAWLTNRWPNDRIQRVEAMILATRLYATPITLQEKILCDADFDNLGRLDFFDRAEAARNEAVRFGGFTGSEAVWQEYLKKLLAHHRWWTKSAAQDRQETFEENRRKIDFLLA